MPKISAKNDYGFDRREKMFCNGKEYHVHIVHLG